ncbi:glycosyltransferase family 4 protein [Fortiea contorta]|uniref:glycosyltransferase family 4 protein n=1 Tax=Fortiea contorta TaxID=1892405 RepID=UPI00034AC0F0|nr:glycosyltransferase family 4 protein [Fortiea contorta]
MHIIVLENELSSNRGGQEISLYDVCHGLSKRGHNISLVYLKEGELISKYQDLCTELIKVNTYRIESKNIIKSCRSLIDAHVRIKTNQDSLVYSNQYHNSFFAYTLAVSKNIPFVCHLRLPPPRKFGFQWYVGMQNVSKLIAVSHQTKSDWVKRGFRENKIDVVHNGINTDKFIFSSELAINKKQLNIPENTKIISYIGRLDKDKGLEILIRAFALFLKSGIKSQLLIAGKPLLQNNNYRESLEQLSKDLKIAEDVRFLGHVSDPVSVYQASDISVLPCLWSEPCPRSIIESMSCGTPVVASRTGGIPEILTGEFENMLFEKGNIQDLTNTINSVLKWQDLDPQLGMRCRHHILENFHVNKMVDGVEQALLKLKNNKI